MSSFFQALGFPVRTMDDLRDLGARVERDGARLGGGVIRWSAGPVEVWAQGEGSAFVPFLDGGEVHRVAVVAVGGPDDEPADQWVEGWLDPAEPDEPFSGRFPFVCNLANLALARERLRRLPAVVPVRLAAFAHEVATYRDALAYELGRSHPFGARSFVSTHHSRVDMEDVEPDPTAIVTGVVESAGEEINGATGLPYLHLRLASQDLVLDCLASPDQVPTRPAPGNVVQGTWWIVGRVED